MPNLGLTEGASDNERAIARALLLGLLGTPTISAAAESSNARVVTIQLKDASGANLARKQRACVWVSDTAGGVPSSTAPNGATSITGGTVLAVTTAKVLFDVVSTAAGVIELTITETTAKSFFVNVQVGSAGAESAAIAFV